LIAVVGDHGRVCGLTAVREVGLDIAGGVFPENTDVVIGRSEQGMS